MRKERKNIVKKALETEESIRVFGEIEVVRNMR